MAQFANLPKASGLYTLNTRLILHGRKKLEEIGKEIDERWENTQTAIAHRVGRLDISDIAVVIAVSTPHRKDAFEASRYAIERIKEIVPIWKKEHWENGELWIGDQKEQVSYEGNLPAKEEMQDD